MKNLNRISFQIAVSALVWTQAKYISLKLCQRWINVPLCKYFDKNMLIIMFFSQRIIKKVLKDRFQATIKDL